ncbi:MAG: hypothetical protein NXH85_12925 [Pseudomonadaceae bacterium]|nr:hypothetical protein [Pseudomonadaceae bacterium]
MAIVTPAGTSKRYLIARSATIARTSLIALLSISTIGSHAQASTDAPEAATQSTQSSATNDDAPRSERIDAIVETAEPRSDDPVIRAAQEQLESNETLQARTLLSELIRQRESSFDRYNPDLIEPLLVLGDVKRAEKDFVGALDSYSRAIHIERVNSGLISPTQLSGVYREAATLAEMGDLAAANDRHEYAYITLLRYHGGASMELVPGLLRLADWYMASNNIFSARGLYKHGIDLVEEATSETDDALIPLLAGLAQTYVRQHFPLKNVGTSDASPVFDSFTGVSSTSQSSGLSLASYSQGEKSLQRIVNIERQRDPVDVEALVAAELALADWHLMFLSTGRRWLPLYADVHKQLQDAGSQDSNSRFATPTLLYRPPILSPKASDDPTIEPKQGVVDLVFTVNHRGRIVGSSLKTERSDPPGMLDFRVRRALNNAIYRPSLVDGVPVATDNNRYRHEFTYWPRKDEADERDGVTETTQTVATQGNAELPATPNDMPDAVSEEVPEQAGGELPEPLATTADDDV